MLQGGRILTFLHWIIRISMSRKANCYDNACIESFFSRFKAECFYRYQLIEKDQVRKAVKIYLRYYNYKRFQKKLNNLSSVEYGTKAA